MADKPASERTEQATPERLRKAREEGRVPQSTEVPSALMIILLLAVLAVAGPPMFRWLVQEMRDGLSFKLSGNLDGPTMSAIISQKVGASLLWLLPFFVAGCVATVVGSVAVGGWTVSAKSIGFKLSNISPFSGFGNFFSMKTLGTLAATIVKLLVVGIITWKYWQAKREIILEGAWSGTEGMVATISSLVLGLATRIAAAIAALAALDWLFQRWQYRRGLRMTRQEVKEERRNYELSSEIKGRQRSIQLSTVKKRMLQKVKTADVVVANPTHVAVAIRYRREENEAPVVVAKGADLLAQKIKEIAKENGVAVIERPELARTLFKTVEVDQPIPENLFVAVAEILAMIHRLRKRRLLGTI